MSQPNPAASDAKREDETVAEQFQQFFFPAFAENRQNLAALYRDVSMLTMNPKEPDDASKAKEIFVGPTAIVEKLQSLPLSNFKCAISTTDSQPLYTTGGVLVMFTGQFLMDEGGIPIPFSMTFSLVKEEGTFWVLNHILRITLG